MAIVGLCVVLALLGWWGFSWGVLGLLVACAVAAATRPARWPVYAWVVLAPALGFALRDRVPATPLLPLVVACMAAAFAGSLFGKSRDAKRDAVQRARLRRLAYIGFGLTLFPLYPFAKLGWASLQVQRFCASVRPGDAISGLEPNARRLGLDVMNRPAHDDRPASFSAWQGFVFARKFCSVEHDGTRALKVEKSSLD
ncbi:MAG: hypothetical protein QM756_41290 [Polyangiaceae bacterium]